MLRQELMRMSPASDCLSKKSNLPRRTTYVIAASDWALALAHLRLTDQQGKPASFGADACAGELAGCPINRPWDHESLYKDIAIHLYM